MRSRRPWEETSTQPPDEEEDDDEEVEEDVELDEDEDEDEEDDEDDDEDDDDEAPPLEELDDVEEAVAAWQTWRSRLHV